jgi:uncharacterized protein YndB with AHSA1/START domain
MTAATGGVADPSAHDATAGAEVAEETRIDASPAAVYALISDVTQMGRWSPETSSCRWLGGADRPAVGARFRGTNRLGWRRWSTTCTVTAAEPGRRFAFEVRSGPLAVATWSYELTGDDGATIAREHWCERRAPWFRRLTGLLLGVPDRTEHNRAGMRATLAALRAAAEAGADPST